MVSTYWCCEDGLTVACDNVPCGGVERGGEERDVERRCGRVYDGVHPLEEASKNER